MRADRAGGAEDRDAFPLRNHAWGLIVAAPPPVKARVDSDGPGSYGPRPVRRALTFLSISLLLRAGAAIAEEAQPVVTPPVIAVGEEADGPFETTTDSTGFSR